MNYQYSQVEQRDNALEIKRRFDPLDAVIKVGNEGLDQIQSYVRNLNTTQKLSEISDPEAFISKIQEETYSKLVDQDLMIGVNTARIKAEVAKQRLAGEQLKEPLDELVGKEKDPNEVNAEMQAANQPIVNEQPEVPQMQGVALGGG